jgi:hypothetical protein
LKRPPERAAFSMQEGNPPFSSLNQRAPRHFPMFSWEPSRTQWYGSHFGQTVTKNERETL